MNKKLGLAVAGALVAFASTANAGITIPAGDWTVDIGGNVNTYYSNTRFSGDLFKGGNGNVLGTDTANTIGTGLLPSALGIGAKTRQNDLDIAVQFTFFVGANSESIGSGGNGSNGAQGNSLNIRQAFMSFGDASWGTIKAGRDLGIFGSDAILSDMTLLGVGTGAGGAGNSTLGRIGSGYAYADWMGQVTYSTPNWNGFQVVAGVREPWANSANADVGFNAKATYDFAANDVTGRVWVGGLTQKIDAVSGTAGATVDSKAWEIGGKASYQGIGLVGYYYNGQNMGAPAVVLGGVTPASGLGFANTGDTSGGYVQGTFVVPGVGTKLGASWGQTTHANTGTESKNESWIIGAYHPLTKSLNLVAEYTDTELTNYAQATDAIGSANPATGLNGKAKTFSLGAILFF
jgi:predicted porin